MRYTHNINPSNPQMLSVEVGNAFGMWLLMDGYVSNLKDRPSRMKTREKNTGNGERIAKYSKKDHPNLIICLETGAMCENAGRRYNLFLRMWLKRGAEMMTDLNLKADELYKILEGKESD